MRPKALHIFRLLGIVVLALSVVAPAMAQRVPALRKDAAIIVDGVSGRVLYERNGYEARYPASLAKMMTLYLLFEAFENGSLSFDTQLPTSRFASGQRPTKLNLRRGQKIDAKTAMEALIVRSANDVAVVVAEAIGGSHGGFVHMMTQKARELGMLDTRFANSHGLPDAQQISTASDMALLGRRLAYDFPDYYPFLALDEFRFNGRRYTGHNNLLGVFDGTDGIKTGYTRSSGFNLVTSVVRGNKHIVAVVMGGRTAASRDKEMMRILSIAFEEVDKEPLLIAHANVPWVDRAGSKISPSWNSAVPPPVFLAAFGPQVQSARSTQATHAQVWWRGARVAKKATAVEALPSESAVIPRGKPLLQVIIPREKPRLPVIASTVHNYTGRDTITTLVEGWASLIQQESATDAKPSAPINQISLLLPIPKPSYLKHTSTTELEQGDIGGSSADIRRWSVQIGAFASENTANAQLDVYAHSLVDILGQAERIIIPFSGEGDRTYYRARFGPFAESEAQAVCQSMIKQGKTCFTSEYGPDT